METLAVPINVTVDHEEGVEIGGRLLRGTLSGADAGITVTRKGDDVEIGLLLSGATALTSARGLRSINVKVSRQGILYEIDHEEALRPGANWCCVTTPYECGSQTRCGWGMQCITCNNQNYCSQDCS